MTAGNVSSYLSFANVQMAAEATGLGEVLSGKNLVIALTEGNGRASSFTDVQAQQFAQDWQLIAYQENTSTGFSGSVFKYTGATDPSKGLVHDQLVMSFRSTEFIDDAARDNQATNSLEIKETGWAFGQIDDMKKWVDGLYANGTLPSSTPLTVTGYSLGGHLASAFSDLYPNKAAAIYTFNGAGVGKLLNGRSLAYVIDDFDKMRNNTGGLASKFTDPAVIAAYNQIRSHLQGGVKVSQADRDLVRWIIPASDDAALLLSALNRIDSIVDYNTYVQNLHGGGAGKDPAKIDMASIEATKLDYQLAVLFASRNTKAYSLASGAFTTLFDTRNTVSPPRANFYDIYGATFPSVVASSQLHYGVPAPVFIENQPLTRGTVTSSAINASWDAFDYRLLVDGYSNNDFGDTHSLVLLVDSLSVQGTLSQLAPSVDQGTLNLILQSASYALAKSNAGTNSQGLAEGDVLENVVNALSDLALGPGNSVRLKGNPNGNTWWVKSTSGITNGGYATRDDLHNALAQISKSPVVAALKSGGGAKLIDSTSIAAKNARTDFGVYVALYSLSPFAIINVSDSLVAALSTQWGAVLTNWTQDKALQVSDPQSEKFNISNEWIKDRAAFLERKNWFNNNNINPLVPVYDFPTGPFGNPIPNTITAPYYAEDAYYEDVATGYQISLKGQSPATLSAQTQRFYFADSAGRTYAGASADDHLYGGSGNDNMSGQGGNDYIETGAGDDVLDGGANNDTLVGGAGNDTYRFSGAFGSDLILDASGTDHLEIDGYAGGLPAGKWLHDGYYQSEDKQVNYMLTTQTRGGSTVTDLVITLASQSGASIRIRNFDQTNHNFGIVLDDGPVPSAPVDHVFNGDFIKSNPTGSSYAIVDRNYVSAGAQANAQDVTNGTADADSIWGLGGNDAAQGSSGDDFIDGGAGDDLLLGGYGSDTIFGSAGNDHIFGSGLGYVDTPQASNFTPPASQGVEIARGFSWVIYNPPGVDASGMDVIQYAGANVMSIDSGGYYELEGNYIDGGAGNDSILAGTGRDTVFGGADNDTVYGLFMGDAIFGDGGDDQLWGDGIQGAYGTYTPSSLHGNDTLYGGTGNDWLIGQGGDDELYGGSDNDTLLGDDSNYTDTPDTITGNDYLDGGDGADQLVGGGRSDQLFGGQGNDSLWGDAVDDNDALPLGANGKDYLDGEEGNDQLIGGGDDDELFGGMGNDLLWGDDSFSTRPNNQSTGNDYLDGEDGDDQLIGGRGDDTLYGGIGNDVLVGDDRALAANQGGDDELYGEAGLDTIEGGGGNDLIDGGGDADSLSGNDGNDTLLGGAGEDSLYGNEGNDVLIGGADTDGLAGGNGDDVYRFSAGDSPINALNLAEAITDTQGRNTAVFDGSVSLAGVTTSSLAGGHLVVRYTGSDTLVVVGGLKSNLRFQFQETGETLSTAQLVSRTSTAPQTWVDADGATHVYGAGAADTLSMTSSGSVAYGGRGDDTISASVSGVDVLYSLGDGTDHVQATKDATGAKLNRLVMDDGIVAADTRWTIEGGSLKVVVDNASTGAIYIDGFDPTNAAQSLTIDQLVYQDGTVLTAAQLLAQATSSAGTSGSDLQYGLTGNDTLQASAGDDTLKGGAGGDTYQWQLGMGQDVIDDGGTSAQGNDTLFVSGNASPGSDIILNQSGNDLLIRSRSGSDTVRVVGQFAGKGLEFINFVGQNTVWDASFIATHLTNELTENGDSYTGTSGNDYINARGGNDSIYGANGADLIDGGSGNDYLNGGYGNDTLIGGAGSDTLSGNFDNDVLDGRKDGAADTLTGDDGSDIYLFGRGSGADVINDLGNPATDVDVLEIDADVHPDDLKVSAASQYVTLQIRGTTDSISFGMTMPEYAGVRDIETIKFDDGTVWSSVDVRAKALKDAPTTGNDSITGFRGNDVIDGKEGNDTLKGDKGDDSLIGGLGNDSLDGGDGNDTLDGGQGTDTLTDTVGDNVFIDGETVSGGGGSDTYIYTTFSNATIYDTGSSTGQDTLVLPFASTDAAILRASNSTTGDNDDLLIKKVSTSETIRLDKYFYAQSDDTRIKRIVFSNGVTLTPADILGHDPWYTPVSEGDNGVTGYRWGELIDGLGGNDFIDGARGNDTLKGGAGNDTLKGSIGDDSLVGGSGNDVLYGDSGDSSGAYVLSTDGADTLDGGTGDDKLYGSGGNDTYVIGVNSGYDTIYGGSGTDQVYFDQGVDPLDVSLYRDGLNLVVCVKQDANQAVFNNYFSSSYTKLGAITFYGGTSWSTTDIDARIVSGVANAMTGTVADNTYTVDNAGDTVTEGQYQGTDTILSSVSYTLPANVEYLTLTGFIGTSGTGNDLANKITGNIARNVLQGGLGIDTLIGGGGDDTYYVHYNYANGTPSADSDTDQIVEYAGDGTDTVYTLLDYTLTANVENLTELFEGTSKIALVGNDLANVITGQTSGDTLNGGLGADTMIATGGGSDSPVSIYNMKEGASFYVDNVNDKVVAGGHYFSNINQVGDMDTVYTTVDYTLSSGIENLVMTGSAMTGRGNELNNNLFGRGGSDRLEGGAGNDRLFGALGYDTYAYSNGKGSQIEYSAVGTDVLVGGTGDDKYYVEWGVDQIMEAVNEGVDTAYVATSSSAGSSYSLSIYANVESIAVTSARNDITLIGNDLDNSVLGWGQRNRLDGGKGNDYISDGDLYSSVSYGSNTLVGGEGNDRLKAVGGNDTLQGDSGNDTLTAISSNNTLKGGTEDDTYVVQATTNTIIENADEGIDTVQSAVTFSLSGIANVENLTLTGGAVNTNGTGSELKNTLTGNAGNNTLWGLGGDDTLDGGVGADVMIGGDGNDTYYIDNVGDVVTEDEAPDDFTNNDIINTSVSYTGPRYVESMVATGTDNINLTTLNTDGCDMSGNVGNNYLKGSDGLDFIYGDEGADTLEGGAGDDYYYLTDNNDTVIEQAGGGLDQIWAYGDGIRMADNVERLYMQSAVARTAYGNEGNNYLTGNNRNNTLYGNGGNDKLWGLGGDDTFYGGTGNDTLLGAGGNDTYHFQRGDGADAITDLDSVAGNADVLNLDGAINANQVWFAQSGNDLVMSVIGTTDKVTIASWFLGAVYQVESIVTAGDGKMLSNGKVNDLVNAMAGFTPPAVGQTTLPANYQTALDSVMASSWT